MQSVSAVQVINSECWILCWCRVQACAAWPTCIPPFCVSASWHGTHWRCCIRWCRWLEGFGWRHRCQSIGHVANVECCTFDGSVNRCRRFTKMSYLVFLMFFFSFCCAYSFGSEPPSVEDDVDAWHYAILEFHARNDNDVLYELKIVDICQWFDTVGSASGTACGVQSPSVFWGWLLGTRPQSRRGKITVCMKGKSVCLWLTGYNSVMNDIIWQIGSFVRVEL